MCSRPGSFLPAHGQRVHFSHLLTHGLGNTIKQQGFMLGQ